ncbi:MAG: hypothetical protein RDU20_19040 [Desulfomonilaceae bacterium]|nr:hypothetical protein [Desulfomonilaceae bacterium]
MKRLDLACIALVVAFGLCTVFLTSPAGCDDVDRSIDEVLTLSGVSKQLDTLTSAMAAAVPDDAFSSGKTRKEVDRFLEKAAREHPLASKVRYAIKLDLNRDALYKVLDFYRSRLGRKVGRLQGNALIPSSIQEVREGRHIVASLPRPRADVLERIIDAQRVTRANFRLLDQMVNGLADGFLDRGHSEAERIRDQLRYLVEKAQAADDYMGGLAMAAYARTLRDLNDKELNELAEFNESEPARWFHDRVQRGVEEAVYKSARTLGEAITEAETPKPSADAADR